jgi:hypothetical protein
MKVSTENDNNFRYEKITILGDNMPLSLDLTKELWGGHTYNELISKTQVSVTVTQDKEVSKRDIRSIVFDL